LIDRDIESYSAVGCLAHRLRAPDLNETKKRVAMAETQAATVEAKRALQDALGEDAIR
jgi:hypothetical protein